MTTEKDVIRNINHQPGPYFLLNNIKKDKDADKNENDDKYEFEDDFDNFIMIDKEDLYIKLKDQMNADPEKLKKEE